MPEDARREIAYIVEVADDPFAGSVRFVSDDVRDVLGYAPDDFYADPGLWLSAVHPDDLPVLEESTRLVWERQVPGVRRYRMRHHQTGELVWIEDVVSPQVDSDGRVARIQGVARDVTGPQRDTEQLALLTSAVAQTGDHVLITDAAGTITYANPAVEAATGYGQAELIGTTPALFKSGEHDAGFYQSLWDTILAGRVFRGVFINRKKSGEIYQEEKVISPIRNRDGMVTHFVSTGRDITERRRAEEALKASEARLQFQSNLLQSVGEAVIATDLAGAILFWNKAAERIYGWKSEEVLGRNIIDVATTEQSKEQGEEIIAALQAGRSWSGEFLVRHRDGHSFPAMVTDTSLLDDGGKLVGLIGVSTDITERRRQEDERLAAQRDLAATLDAIPDLLFEVGLDGRYHAYHSPREDLLAAPPEELLGKTVFDVLPAEAAAICMAALRDAHDGGWSAGKQFVLPLGQGTFWFELSVSRKPVSPGQEPRFIVLSRDVTERKRAEAERDALEAQLFQSQKMEAVGQLAGGVAHDFNNMLGVILGFSEMAMVTLDPATPAYADIEQIRDAALRSADLIRQLLAFARQQAIAPKQQDLSDSVGSMLTMLRPLIGEHIRLVWRPEPQPCPVYMDPSQLDQILANLTVNARDAISGSGTITIATANLEADEGFCGRHPGAVPGRYVLLKVSDDGCGMDEETQARVFEPFFTTKPTGQGTGLGLATVYGIARQNGGFIEVDSEPGRGTTMTVYLPCHDPETSPTAPTTPTAELGNRAETVLLVEDEPALLTLTTRMLEGLGYTVLASGSPNEAIRLAEVFAGPIDLLVTDVVMPEMNGVELRRRVRARRPGLKSLFISGYAADVIAHSGVAEEGIELLPKPFTRQSLALRIREALA